jgi:hypothetical protein
MSSSLYLGSSLAHEVTPYRAPVEMRRERSLFADLVPHAALSREVAQWRRRNLRYALPGYLRYLRARAGGGFRAVGTLHLAILDPDGKETDYGLASLDLITNSGAGFVVDALQGLTLLSTMRYHGVGSSNTSLVVGNTALATELAASYSTTNVRTVGTVAEGATGLIFVTVATTTFATTVAVAEWGLFSQAATNTGSPTGGILFDRATFATQNVLSSFRFKSTFTLTVAAGA